MRSREEVLREFDWEECVNGYECNQRECVSAYAMAGRIRELEAQQTAGEPVAEHVAWLRYVDWPNGQTSIRVCDSDDEGAFKVYAHPRPRVGVTVTPMYDHPSGKGATEAQIEAVARSFYGTFYPCDRLWADCPDDIRGWWLDAASDALTAALALADEAAPGVVELDEWAILDVNGKQVQRIHGSKEYALDYTAALDRFAPIVAPHRAMRVCLQPLANGGGEVDHGR